MRQELVVALRSLRRSPLLVLVVALSLGLGIGVNTAIFSLVDQTLVRPITSQDPASLAVLDTEGDRPGSTSSDNRTAVFSYPLYRDLRANNEVFAGLAARSASSATVVYEDTPERARAELVSGNYFTLLGFGPALGRLFSDADDQKPGGHPVMVLSHGYWKRRFGSSPSVVGQEVKVNGTVMTVVGVAPASLRPFVRGKETDFYAPLAMLREVRTMGRKVDEQRREMWLNLFGRLKPGLTHQAAAAGLAPLYRQQMELEVSVDSGEFPGPLRQRFLDHRVEVRSGRNGINGWDGGTGQVKVVLASLVAMTLLVLVITCTNLASLLLARGAARRKEIAVRLALGAGRWALVRQLLIESLLMSALGGVLGLVVAGFTLEALLRFAGEESAFLSPEIDVRVMAAAAALTLLATLLAGLLPALRSTRLDVAPVLKDQSMGAGSSRAHNRLRRAMVFAQVALSALLLVGGALFSRSLYNTMRVDPGFDVSNLLSFGLAPRLNGYEVERTRALYDGLEQRLARMPGVKAVGMTSTIPLTGNTEGSSRSNTIAEGFQRKDREDTTSVVYRVNPGYFEAVRMPLKLGRFLSARDTAASPKVAVVDETLAEYYFKGQNPLGRRIGFGGDQDKPDLEIVGVVPKVRHFALTEKRQHRMVFLPVAQMTQASSVSFLVRTAGDPTQLAPQARRALAELDPVLPMYRVSTVERLRDESLVGERLLAVLSGSFAGLAALIAGLGLYGLLAYSVAQQRREMGIRLALGADGGDLVRLVVREALLVVLLGMALGLAGGVGFGRLAESALYGLKASDPGAVGGAGLLLAGVALVAVWLPARRAARIDPLQALRHE